MKWVVSYLSTWLGLCLIQLVGALVLLPVILLLFLGGAIFGEDKLPLLLVVISIAYSPIWLWFAFSFFFPIGWKIIMRGLKGIFAIEYLSPGEAKKIVMDGVVILRSDLARFGGLLGV